MVMKPSQASQKWCLSLRLTTKSIKFCFTTVIVVIAVVTVLLLGSWSTLIPVIHLSFVDNFNGTYWNELIRNFTVSPNLAMSLEETTTLKIAASTVATRLSPATTHTVATEITATTIALTTFAPTAATTTIANTTIATTTIATTTPPLEDCGEKFYQSRVWPDPGPPYQCVGVPGRLGNAMFTYASSLGVAAIDNRTMVVNSDNELLSHFKLKALVNCGNRLCNNRKGKHEAKGCCVFYEDLLAPEPSAPELGVGLYLQSWRYFAHVQSELRRQFTPYGSTAEKVDRVKARIRQEVQNVTKQEVTYVGLHVRHGDILRQQNFIDHGYLAATEGFYHRAMMWFVRRYPRVVFLVSSDDEEFTRAKILANCTGWSPVQATTAPLTTSTTPAYATSKETAPSNNNNNTTTTTTSAPAGSGEQEKKLQADTLVPALCRYVTSDQPIVDMLVLASCGHVIMSTGTYGWWTGWLGGGTVIYYSHPVREGSELGKQTNLTDHFPLHWIPMD